MANYGFRCKRCKAEFELYDLEPKDVPDAFCVECRGERLEIIKYDDSENAILVWIGEELKRCNARLDHILDLIDDEEEQSDTRELH